MKQYILFVLLSLVFNGSVLLAQEVTLEAQASQVRETYVCVGSGIDGEDSILVLDVVRSTVSEAVIAEASLQFDSPLPGPFTTVCERPDPPKSPAKSWPYLKCTFQVPRNSGYVLNVYGDRNGITEALGSAWKDGAVVAGKLQFENCSLAGE